MLLMKRMCLSGMVFAGMLMACSKQAPSTEAVTPAQPQSQTTSSTAEVNAEPTQAQVVPMAATSAPAYTETPIRVGEGKWELPGTLVMPKGRGPFPGVILVHGSGPNDRNSEIGAAMPFKDIAEGLAGLGIASLRYDKRSLTHMSEMIKLPPTLETEVLEDALLALKTLSEQPDIDKTRLFIVGHSLGAQLSPELVKRSPLAAGAILLAAPARKPWEIILEQFRYLEQPAELIQMAEKAHEALSQNKATAEDKFFGIPASYWIEWGSFDPIATAKSLDKPLLVLSGERDYQTPQADYDLWKEAFPADARVQLERFPKLNHLFIEGEGKPSPQEYFTKGHVSPKVIQRIANFISAVR